MHPGLGSRPLGTANFRLHFQYMGTKSKQQRFKTNTHTTHTSHDTRRLPFSWHMAITQEILPCSLSDDQQAGAPSGRFLRQLGTVLVRSSDAAPPTPHIPQTTTYRPQGQLKNGRSSKCPLKSSIYWVRTVACEMKPPDHSVLYSDLKAGVCRIPRARLGGIFDLASLEQSPGRCFCLVGPVGSPASQGDSSAKFLSASSCSARGDATSGSTNPPQ